MKRHFWLFSTLIFCIALSSCAKEDIEETPPGYISSFNFYLNGEPIYDPEDHGYKMTVSSGIFGDSYLGMTAKLKELDDRGQERTLYQFYLSVDPVRIGRQPFNTHSRQTHIRTYGEWVCKKYRVDIKKPHETRITFHDPDENIIRGSFYYSGYDECGNTVEVTKGEFDLKYLVY